MPTRIYIGKLTQFVLVRGEGRNEGIAKDDFGVDLLADGSASKSSSAGYPHFDVSQGGLPT